MPDPTASDRPVGPGHRRYERALRIGLVVSIGLHLLLLFGIGSITVRAARFGPATERARALQGLQVVDAREIPAPQAPEQIRREPEPEPEPPIETPAPPIAEPSEGGRPVPVSGREEEGQGLTNAEKLRPREGDARLWNDFSDQPMPEYLEDRLTRAQGLLRARLSVMLDSLNLSEEQRRKAVEWLTSDGRIGITPDGIKLGDLVIPMNLGALFQEEGPRGREARREQRDREQIQLNDLLGEIQEVQKERAEAMRQRSREEATRRAAADSSRAEPDSGSGAPPPRP